MVGQERKEAPAERQSSVLPDGVSILGYVDDIAVVGRRGVDPRHTRGVWDMRPPRPGRARPVARGRAGRQMRRRGRPPRHGAEDLLRGVLASCRLTGMMVRLDLGEQFGNAPLVLGTAGDLRAWESFGPAATRRNRPPERGRPRLQRARRRRMVYYRCGGHHHVRECPDASETMRERLMALHRTGGIRRNNRVGPSAAATPTCQFGDMSMTESSGGERKSGDGDQDQTTDPEMPTLTEDPLPPDGGDPRQEEVEDAGPAVPMTVIGRRYLGWTRLGGHIYERPREERENTGPEQRTLDASAAPWQPSLQRRMIELEVAAELGSPRIMELAVAA